MPCVQTTHAVCERHQLLHTARHDLAKHTMLNGNDINTGRSHGNDAALLPSCWLQQCRAIMRDIYLTPKARGVVSNEPQNLSCFPKLVPGKIFRCAWAWRNFLLFPTFGQHSILKDFSWNIFQLKNYSQEKHHSKWVVANINRGTRYLPQAMLVAGAVAGIRHRCSVTGSVKAAMLMSLW